MSAFKSISARSFLERVAAVSIFLAISGCGSKSKQKDTSPPAQATAEESEGSDTSLTAEDTAETTEGGDVNTPTSATPVSDPQKPDEKDHILALPTQLFSVEEAIFSENKTFAMKATWLQGPEVGYANEVELVFADSRLLLPESVDLESFKPWMGIHGHGGGEKKMTVTRDRERPNVYRAAGFYPIMAGPWELIIRASVNGASDTVEVTFKI